MIHYLLTSPIYAPVLLNDLAIEMKDPPMHQALCRNTINTAEYAAAAARLSTGLATVVNAIRPRKRTI